MYKIVLPLSLVLAGTVIYSDATTINNLTANVISTTHDIVENSLLITTDYIPYLNQTKINKELEEYFNKLKKEYDCTYSFKYEEDIISTYIDIYFDLKYNAFIHISKTITHEVIIKGGFMND